MRLTNKQCRRFKSLIISSLCLSVSTLTLAENDSAQVPASTKQAVKNQAAKSQASEAVNSQADEICQPATLTREKVRAPQGKKHLPSGQSANYLCDPLRPQAIGSKVPRKTIAVADRWRIVDSLPGYEQNLLDPYNRNILKGDKPLFDDWFFAFTGVSDTVYEARRLPTPVGFQSSDRAGANDIFGRGEQATFNQNLLMEFVYFKGDSIYRPPDLEFRLIPVFNYNQTQVEEVRALRIDPNQGLNREDDHIGIQGAFVDYHIRNVSDRYDFDSLRVGIQPFNSDFRGFLFQDNQLGVRLFGTRDNNIFQYNLAFFRRLEKNTNSGLNDISQSPRKDDVYIANLFWQDFPKLGFNSQAIIAHNRNREGEFFYDDNGFIQRPFSLGAERPRFYDATYLGINGDGHFGRLGVSASSYYVLGENKASIFSDQKTDISAFFAAAEFSYDFDWRRLRLSAVYASGDADPFDDKDTGYDAIFENPQIAGSDTSFWIRQGVPLIGGGGVTLTTRNGLLANLNASKEHGQSNFTNPGLWLAGLGMDFDLTPTTRLSFNVNHLWFDHTATLEVARNQGNIARSIGWDVSAAYIWRPFATQNVVFRLSAAVLVPDEGYNNLFKDEMPYSVLANLILTY
jgi:hypothetical protein